MVAAGAVVVAAGAAVVAAPAAVVAGAVVLELLPQADKARSPAAARTAEVRRIMVKVSPFMVAAITDDLGALVLKLPLIVRAPPGFPSDAGIRHPDTNLVALVTENKPRVLRAPRLSQLVTLDSVQLPSRHLAPFEMGLLQPADQRANGRQNAVHQFVRTTAVGVGSVTSLPVGSCRREIEPFVERVSTAKTQADKVPCEAEDRCSLTALVPSAPCM